MQTRFDPPSTAEIEDIKTRPLVASLMETTMQNELKITMEIRATPASVADARKVRLGGESPSFGPIQVATHPGISSSDDQDMMGRVRCGSPNAC